MYNISDEKDIENLTIKDIYDLKEKFLSFTTKTKKLTPENEDLRECIKLMQNPTNLSDYYDFPIKLPVTAYNITICKLLIEHFSEDNLLIKCTGQSSNNIARIKYTIEQINNIINAKSYSLIDCSRDCNCLKFCGF